MSLGLNLELETLQNENYRNVIWTTDQMQLVLMSLEPGDEIPKEIHKNTTQFIKIEKGTATVTINNKTDTYRSGDAIIINAGDEHRIFNSGRFTLQLYTIYTPPVHRHGLKEK